VTDGALAGDIEGVVADHRAITGEALLDGDEPNNRASRSAMPNPFLIRPLSNILARPKKEGCASNGPVLYGTNQSICGQRGNLER